MLTRTPTLAAAQVCVCWRPHPGCHQIYHQTSAVGSPTHKFSTQQACLSAYTSTASSFLPSKLLGRKLLASTCLSCEQPNTLHIQVQAWQRTSACMALAKLTHWHGAAATATSGTVTRWINPGKVVGQTVPQHVRNHHLLKLQRQSIQSCIPISLWGQQQRDKVGGWQQPWIRAAACTAHVDGCMSSIFT